MNKKNGFTLVELLGVIVVLAILALITIPIISNVVNNVRIKSLESSAYGLVEAGNLYYAQYGVNSNIRFDIDNNEISSTDTDKLLTYKGSVKSGVVILNKKGNVTVCVTDGKNAAYKNYNENKVTTKKGQTCTIETNSYIVKLSEEGDTLTELSGEQLTSEIQNLKDEIAALKAKDTELENSKVSSSDLSELDTRLSASISQLSNDISSVDGKIYTPVYFNLSNSFKVNNNNLEYRNTLITLPANSYYVVSAMASGSIPETIVLSHQSGYATSNVCSNVNYGDSYDISCTVSGFTGESQKVYYLWSKHSSNSNGTVNIRGFYFQKQS